MDIKKSNNANLESRRKEMFSIAMVLIISCLFVAFEWDWSINVNSDEAVLTEIIEDIDFNKLKKNRDMVAAISETDDPQDANKVTPAETMIEHKAENTTSKLLIGEGETETPDAKVEEVKPQVLDNQNDKPEGFHAIEELPEFPGGATAFMKWITNNLKYPRDAQNRRLQGRVVVSFLVDENGEVRKLKVEKSDNALLTREVIKVMDRMPKWKPGKHNGTPCTSMVAVPINFQL